MWPIFGEGLKKDLTEADLLLPVKAHRAQDLGEVVEKCWINEVSTKQHPSLWKVLWRVYWKDFFYTGFIFILLETIVK